jgi:nucleoside 2-deoxyribosyltransferase
MPYTCRIYLAGPDIFYPENIDIGILKKDLCKVYGFEGIWPLDLLSSKDPRAIFMADLDAVRESAAVIANLTPWNGASADVGTAVEIGYALGIGIPVFGYTHCAARYRQRVAQMNMLLPYLDNLLANVDNLMIDEAIHASGKYPIVIDEQGDHTNMHAFEQCLGNARYQVLGRLS